MDNPKDNKRSFDEEVNRVLVDMSKMQVDSVKYRDAVNNLEVLCKARSSKTNSWMSADLVVPAVTNILGILLVLNYERLGVITSKAMSFVGKGRI